MATRDVSAFGVQTSNTRSIASTGMINVAGTQPVSSGASAHSANVMRVVEINVERAMDGDANKVIPLRRNRNTPFDATWKVTSRGMLLWKREEIITGAIGYCENGSRVPLEITAKFDLPRGGDFLVTLEIFDSGGTRLGATSDEVNVARSNTDYRFVIPEFRVNNGFYRDTLRFQWTYKQENSGEQREPVPVPFYSFPLRPTEPWSLTPGEQNNPWTDALDLIWYENWQWNQENNIPLYETRISFRNLRGADRRNREKIAEIITKMVNARLGLVYEQRGGAPGFISIPRNADTWADYEFNLTRFISSINDGFGGRSIPGRRIPVNCMDCANIEVTFSNLLGCNLSVLNFGDRFRCNRVRTIGKAVRVFEGDYDEWDFPFALDINGRRTNTRGSGPAVEGHFSYHEIAMVGDDFEHRSRIHDSCLEVDSNLFIDFQQRSPIPLLPTHMQFASTLHFPPEGIDFDDTNTHHYIEMLVINGQNHLNNATQRGRGIMGRRNIL